ncbi:acyl-CoA thioesterase family protein [Plantactinospora sonchi]|uniref:Thioesterase n=1 Tax=Plantactinospora sonchi TaxID=1544735 RepID=A0ABU7RT54_9ACTN
MNTVTATHPVVAPAETEPTRLEIRPRYEGSNICTWIGFKHVNYLIEEAVLDHLRRNGLAPGWLYERYALGVDLVDIDTRILHAYHIDDVAVAEVRRDPKVPDELAFNVVLSKTDAQTTRAASAKVRVSLRHDPSTGPAEPVPAAIADYTVEKLGRALPGAPQPVRVTGRDPGEVLTEGRNAYAWKWRIPYPYCHFTKRVQMSGYLRLMEEVVDLFLADRGVSIRTLLVEQNWIPVVPHSRITILDEALMEEDVWTVFTVEDVFKGLTYTARMDCYAARDDLLVPVATGRITHGYAVIDNRRDWHLVPFDDRMNAALEGK